MAATTVANSSWYSVHRWGSNLWGWYYQHKGVTILSTGKFTQSSTLHSTLISVNKWYGVSRYILQFCITRIFWKIILAVFRGCASCNARKNVATWINTSTLLQRGDGREEVDQWLCLLSHLTYTQQIYFCGVPWTSGCITLEHQKEGTSLQKP